MTGKAEPPKAAASVEHGHPIEAPTSPAQGVSASAPLVFLNGQFVPQAQATVSVLDRNFLYGDGLFETMRVCHRRPFRWPQHLERLQRGAQFLKIKIPHSAQELRRFARELIERNAMNDAVLRLTLSRGVGERGYSPSGAEAPFLVMTLQATPPVEMENMPRRRLATSQLRLLVSDPLSAFKTSNKLLNVVARMEAEALGAEEALLLNNHGEVASAASANIFWIYRDTIFTSPTGRGTLPGITRAVVLELCQSLGLPTNKRAIKPEALLKSEGVFLTLSSLGIISVQALDGAPMNESPLVGKLHRAYWETVHRETGGEPKTS